VAGIIQKLRDPRGHIALRNAGLGELGPKNQKHGENAAKVRRIILPVIFGTVILFTLICNLGIEFIEIPA
jgi:hypothetical protein